MACSGSTNTRASQADEARMELAACKSELACLTSLWEKKRQEMSSQLNKYKSRCSALERKRSSDISGLAHDVNCLQRSVRQALTQLACVKSARDSYPQPTPPRHRHCFGQRQAVVRQPVLRRRRQEEGGSRRRWGKRRARTGPAHVRICGCAGQGGGGVEAGGGAASLGSHPESDCSFICRWRSS